MLLQRKRSKNFLQNVEAKHTFSFRCKTWNDCTFHSIQENVEARFVISSISAINKNVDSSQYMIIFLGLYAYGENSEKINLMNKIQQLNSVNGIFFGQRPIKYRSERFIF